MASENAVRDAAGDRALIVRAGLLCGQGDVSDRFGYWPNRFARGGRAIVPVAPDTLVAAEVQPWSGPRSLPLWLPDSHAGITARDTSAAAAAGLRCRPVADTARAAHEHERALGLGRERRAGLTPEDEVGLLG